MKFISSLAQDISLVPETGKQTMKYMIYHNSSLTLSKLRVDHWFTETSSSKLPQGVVETQPTNSLLRISDCAASV
jgi:hypothetical protein